MKKMGSLNRRNFLRAGVYGTAALTGITLERTAVGAVTKPRRPAFDGLKMGMASYSLRAFPLDQAIAMTRELGIKYINLKSMHLPYNTTTAQRQAVRQKIEDAGLTLIAGGVIYMKNDPAQVRRLFEYARDAGMPTIVASPDPAALDVVEKTAKEFHIRVAIHNHGPGDRHYPSPLDVLRLVADRDPLMGICMDVGHTVRLGEDPVAAIHRCAKRLYSFHVKDENRAAPNGRPVAVGRGVIDIVGVLKALLNIHYVYDVSLEYEAHAKAPMPGLIESYAYMRGVLAAV